MRGLRRRARNGLVTAEQQRVNELVTQPCTEFKSTVSRFGSVSEGKLGQVAFVITEQQAKFAAHKFE